MIHSTRATLRKHAQTLLPGSERAQCHAMANFAVDNGETIAEQLDNFHRGHSQAKRAALIMVEAGCAKEINNEKGYYGTFIFDDGSELS